jgi:hypothetical protein
MSLNYVDCPSVGAESNGFWLELDKMTWQCARWLAFWAVMSSLHDRVLSAPSTLKIGVCNPGSVPYVTIDENGNAAGFDVGKNIPAQSSKSRSLDKAYNVVFSDLWDQAYSQMLKTVKAAKSVPNPLVTEEIASLIGDSPPKLQIMTSQMIQSRLAAKTLDIGMCGFFITLDRLQNFDYVNPYYFPSGFQAVVKKPSDLPSIVDVLNAIVGCVDGKAQLIILILLLFVFIFGHLIVAAENIAASGGNMRKGYFESTQDGMWLSIVIMSTVGFGDFYPVSVFGRTLTVTWIFLAISFMAMLLAVITTRFLTLDLIPDNPVYHISGMSSLEGFSVVTATNVAYTVLLRSFTEMNVTKYPVTVATLLTQG